MTTNGTTVVAVGAKRTREYVLSCLSLFNRGLEEVDLVALGDSISKAAEVSRIITHGLGGEASAAGISQSRKGDSLFTRSSFRVRLGQPSADVGARSNGTSEFVSFSTYHLLLDQLLTQEGGLLVGIEGNPRLLRLAPTESGFQCSPAEGLEALFRAAPEEGKRRSVLKSLTEALYRSGFVVSARWEEIAARLGQFDDVVLGLDTNILFNCVVTQQLLDALAFTCPPDAAPNWILLVVPNTVMHEIEQAANSRDEKGLLSEIGRMGYRALEEILELDRIRDLRGVSLLMVGETDPVLDARVEIKGLREDIRRMAPAGSRQGSPKVSVGDNLIRDQFKTFLRQLNFHKGTFFLTADKSNSALGQVEGLHSIYFPPANGNGTLRSAEVLRPHQVSYDKEQLPLTIPVGKLIYELTVQFGSLFLSANGESMRIDCDIRGDSLEHWISKRLRFAHQDIAKLVARYRKTARVPLGVVEAFWEAEPKNAFSW